MALARLCTDKSDEYCSSRWEVVAEGDRVVVAEEDLLLTVDDIPFLDKSNSTRQNTHPYEFEGNTITATQILGIFLQTLRLPLRPPVTRHSSTPRTITVLITEMQSL